MYVSATLELACRRCVGCVEAPLAALDNPNSSLLLKTLLWLNDAIYFQTSVFTEGSGKAQLIKKRIKLPLISSGRPTLIVLIAPFES